MQILYWYTITFLSVMYLHIHLRYLHSPAVPLSLQDFLLIDGQHLLMVHVFEIVVFFNLKEDIKRKIDSSIHFPIQVCRLQLVVETVGGIKCTCIACFMYNLSIYVSRTMWTIDCILDFFEIDAPLFSSRPWIVVFLKDWIMCNSGPE